MRRLNILKKIKIKRTQDNSIISERPSSHWFSNDGARHYDFIALLPVYNAAKWLNETLSALEKSVDAIIALDDGSTDNTLEILKQNKNVIEIIQKSPKPLSEWHDSQNRYELYLAAHRYTPKWVIAIDGDEVLDPVFNIFKDHILSVNNQIQAFAFHVDDKTSGLITRERYGHRMYRFKEGLTFDTKRLHCRLIPLEITLDEIRLLNIRIYHNAEPETVKTRFEKYTQADPKFQYQSSYKHLLKPFFYKKVYPLGGQLLLSNVEEDGLQRALKVRKIKQYDPIFSNKDRISEIVSLAYQNMDSVENVFRLFVDLLLDAYLVKISRTDGIVAVYSFDNRKDKKVTRVEAWFIEEMHHHRDFFLFFARLYLIKNAKSVKECSLYFERITYSLIDKEILKVRS